MQDATYPLPDENQRAVPIAGTERRSRLVLHCLVCIGLLTGPLAISILAIFPIGIIALGYVLDDPVVQCIGAIVLFLHVAAIFSLLRAGKSSRARKHVVELHQESEPALFALIESVAARVDASPVDCVLIDTNLNASIAQSPIWFGLAGHTTQLTLGLPLIMALDEAELSAVLAHELAHANRSDGALHAILYRVREQARRLDEACHDTSFFGRTTLLRFLRWYLPLLNRHAARTSHSGEFAADAAAASAAGDAALATALLRTYLASAHLNTLWDDYWLSNVRHAAPEQGPWQSFSKKLPDQLRPHRTDASPRNWAALIQESQIGSSAHPSLHSRLNRLGVCIVRDGMTLLTRSCGTSAIHLLGNSGQRLIAYFDANWWRANRTRWADFHVTVPDQRSRLALLDEAAKCETLSIATALERATRAEYLLGNTEARERYNWCISHFPTHPASYRGLGTFLLRNGDASGQLFMDHAQSLEFAAGMDKNR